MDFKSPNAMKNIIFLLLISEFSINIMCQNAAPNWTETAMQFDTVDFSNFKNYVVYERCNGLARKRVLVISKYDDDEQTKPYFVSFSETGGHAAVDKIWLNTSDNIPRIKLEALTDEFYRLHLFFISGDTLGNYLINATRCDQEPNLLKLNAPSQDSIIQHGYRKYEHLVGSWYLDLYK